jgi:hypothetical protein
MSMIVIGNTFPASYLWSKFETEIFDYLKRQIPLAFPTERNLLINTTWFGPAFDNGNYQRALELAHQIDNLFVLATVDPMYISPPDFENFCQQLGNPVVYKIGNYDNSAYEFNFFAPVLADMFARYSEDEIELTEIKYKFINYNRKPRFHRVQLVKQIIQHGLDQHGIQTLGRPDRTYDHDDTNTLFLTIGEKINDYRQHGHWFTDQEETTGIPHDVLSLHNMHYWRHHFLHIIGATMFWPWDDVFVSETQFKPIIGLRPFVINGNARTYQWLRDRGFRTFNHYFDFVDLENTHEDSVHPNIIKLLTWVCEQDNQTLMQLYRHMWADLVHNRERFYEFAGEQRKKINGLFNE